MKAKLAELLAAVMVFSMAAPVRRMRSIWGRRLSLNSIPRRARACSIPATAACPDGQTGVSFATGQAGHPLTDSADFNGIPREVLGPGRGRKSRNLMSHGTATFDGWYNEAGNKILSLPYAFPYSQVSTYKAVWKGKCDESVSIYGDALPGFKYRQRQQQRRR